MVVVSGNIIKLNAKPVLASRNDLLASPTCTKARICTDKSGFLTYDLVVEFAEQTRMSARNMMRDTSITISSVLLLSS
jgi:hypothetical protein